MMLGLQRPKTTDSATGPTYSVGGMMSAKPLATLQGEERAQALARATEANNQPVVQELAAQIRRHWTRAKEAKQEIEQDMLRALRAKRGQYDPDKLTAIRKQGGSEIYMMLFATKARQFKALIGDVFVGSGNDKPWTAKVTPDPTLPPDITAQILQESAQLVAQAEMSGVPMAMDQVRALLRDAKEQAEASITNEAKARGARAEKKIEDMLAEGGFLEALYEFIDDLPVFKSAFIKGPVVMKTPVLKWEQQPDGTYEPTATYENKPRFMRVDPFNMYPSPEAKTVNEGSLIEHHQLSRGSLYDLIGVDGYSEDAIRAVLDAYGAGGLKEWISIDAERKTIENLGITTPDDGLIDALQYWGKASGKMLREWGMSEAEVPDEAKEYDIEAWLIGSWVIKAVINADPMARRPYFKDSFESVAGAFWGNAMFDCMADCQDMCNGAARALSNNLGLSSGPQVWVDVSRLATSEDITDVYPGKLWQFQSDPMGSSAAPIGFFQPSSNSAELMGVYSRFSDMADEYTGIPKYMAGLNGGEGGAGRTASGMSMMITNAGKTIKKMVSSIDFNIIGPAVSSMHTFVMRYVPDPDIKGDLQVIARGATSLVTKDAAQIRRNEFLQLTANPIDMQIMGVDGRAELLREQTKTLDMDSDIIPPVSVIKQRLLREAMTAMPQQAPAEGPAGPNKQLQDGSPATDNFGPRPT